MESKDKPTIICLTPVRNEAWVLDIFLSVTSLWADYIIIADQLSTDGSREIAIKYPKVRLIENNSPVFNEAERQCLLLDEARKIPGKRLLVTLDADEIFSPNFMKSQQWQDLLDSPAGVVAYFKWANICPNLKQYWSGEYMDFALMDDNSEHPLDGQIHVKRLPYDSHQKPMYITDFSIIHLQYINWERMISKHRWYQCYELANVSNVTPIELYVKYHHMYNINQYYDVPTEWKAQYQQYGIDIWKYKKELYYWFDLDILNFFDKYGEAYFRKLDIWRNIDWNAVALFFHRDKRYFNPQKFIDKIYLWRLRAYDYPASCKLVRRIEHKTIEIWNKK